MIDEGILELTGAAAVEAAAAALTARGGTAVKCANCETSVIGPYCAYCGQEHDTHRRSVYNLVKDFLIDLVNVDSRILRTIIALLFRPGELPRAFREGRTQRYIPAMRLYLFTSLIFFLVLSATHVALMQLEVIAVSEKVVTDAQGKTFIVNPAWDAGDHDPDMPRLIPIPKSRAFEPGGPVSFSTRVHFFSRIGAYQSKLTQAQKDRIAKFDVNIDVDSKSKPADRQRAKAASSWIKTRMANSFQKLAADPAALNEPLTTWLPRIMFLLLPAYAFLLTLFYWRKRKAFYFVDHLVFSLNIHTAAFVLLLLAAAAAQVVTGEYVALAAAAAGAVYTFIAMKRFYAQGWFWTTMKFGFVHFVYVCFFAFPALIAVLVLSVFGGPFG